MKRTALMLLAALSLGVLAGPSIAQTPHKTKTSVTHAHHKKTVKKPKNEITKLVKARKTNHTVRQITPDPKKSPGKHADNLSKNVNHEINRESKDVNHFFQGKKKKQ